MGIIPTGRWGWPEHDMMAMLRPLKPYTFHIALAVYMPVLLYADVQTQTLAQQHLLGVVTFAFLYLALRFSPPSERWLVWLLVINATGLELFSSGLWGVYAYRFGNVPLFVPPGHGLIYLFALRSARTPLMANHGKTVGLAALALATVWAVGGFTIGPLFFGRLDASAVMLWPIFAFFMWKSSSREVYAAAFFVTSALELVGTAFGNWVWATVMPVIQLAAGNPPSVIAGAYCCLDLSASRMAKFLPILGGRLRIKKPDQEIPARPENEILASGGIPDVATEKLNEERIRPMPANTYRFVEEWWIPGASPDEVYRVISDSRLLPQWWKGVYLESEPLDGWTEPHVGSRTRVKARGFLPYKLDFILESTALEPGRLVEVKTIGDFVGVWRATISPEPGGTRVGIDWQVTVEKPIVRFLSPVLKPLFAWNHYWTTPRGEAGLRAYLREHGEPETNGSQRVASSSRAVLRPDDFRHETIQVGDLRMHLVVEGPEDGPLVVMLHGFPEFWYSWRYQIKALAAAGYRVAAPDQRGYNLTDKHGPYDISTLAADVARLIQILGYQKATIIGHDWGGTIAWALGAQYPHITEKLIVCNAPHPSALVKAWNSLYLPQIARSWYMLMFQIPGLPERLLSANNYQLLARNLKRDTKGALNDQEIGYFKQAWSQPGALTGGLNWYRTMFRSWRRGELGDFTVHAPALLIWGDQDTFLTKQVAEWTRRYVPNLTLRYIRGASHWVPQDSPETINRYILDFLEDPVSSRR